VCDQDLDIESEKSSGLLANVEKKSMVQNAIYFFYTGRELNLDLVDSSLPALIHNWGRIH